MLTGCLSCKESWSYKSLSCNDSNRFDYSSIHALVLYPWFWIIMRMLTGFCFAVLFVVIESWVNNRSSNENRGVIFSVYVMITLSVQAVGQFLMLLYEPNGIELFAIVSILVTIAAIPIALSTSPAPYVDQDVSFNLKKLYKISPAAVIGCLFIGFANGSFLVTCTNFYIRCLC